ncbi:hypothetical protein P154DRAFT_571867 [Amniculicola lignicola CBS 123094]|uniref:Uncharacterized protein n=1 Tax=Amniculicola lignicola CBS 123094 TaxID=1392246 RepID=A0A6A5WSV9_9PLEO|nr:hypothetical protein P154DRAFT_571867 [Amniculicola lignicola CBS 123094]
MTLSNPHQRQYQAYVSSHDSGSNTSCTSEQDVAPNQAIRQPSNQVSPPIQAQSNESGTAPLIPNSTAFSANKRPRTLSDTVEIEGFVHSDKPKPKPARTQQHQKSFHPAFASNGFTPEEHNRLLSAWQLPGNCQINWWNKEKQVACVFINTSWVPEADPLVPLYQDVVGMPPPNQHFISDILMDENLFRQSEIEQEFARAVALSKKQIGNAPRFERQLPEDLMKDITLEEAIVYFPNHVLKWPGLALSLRMNGWDQTFHRVAYLINLTRGSLYYDRDERHAEPLPCMLKVQSAIQEFVPEYRLADHDSRWAREINHEWLQQVFFQKPKVFPGDPIPVTLEEAGSWVPDPPLEFQNLPFTKRIKKAMIEASEAKITNPIVRAIFKIGRKQSDISMPDYCESEAADDTPSTRPLAEDACPLGAGCVRQNSGCPFDHLENPRVQDKGSNPESEETVLGPTHLLLLRTIRK